MDIVDGIVLLVNVICFKAVQLANAADPMLFIKEPASNITLVKLVQLENAPSPIVVRFDGMVMEVRPLPENAPCPMLFNKESLSNVTVVKLVQMEKAQ